MATEDEHAVSPFPHPPAQFYKQYTDENVKAGKVPAPPAPVKGVYFMFGAKFDTEDVILRPLQEQNLKQLYPEVHDRKAELKKLNRSINVCFLELLDILIVNPASPARNQKISDLSILFINMHHLINEFRPHQARETLKVIMERQKKQREDLISQIQRDMEEARSILKDCGELATQATSTIPRSMKLATTEKVEGGEGTVKSEGKDSSDSSGSKTGQDHMSSGNAAVGGNTNEAWKLVERQNTELCGLIDSLLIPNT